jgi:hypothetical protein
MRQILLSNGFYEPIVQTLLTTFYLEFDTAGCWQLRALAVTVKEKACLLGLVTTEMEDLD